MLLLLTKSLLLVATGDALMHGAVKRCAADSGYDFLYEKVKPLVSQADIAFVNVEFPVAPNTGSPGRPFVFNAPVDAVRALMDAGFNVFNLANNHAFDQGRAGLVETCSHLDSLGANWIGAGRVAPEAKRPLILEINGITVGFLAYTDLLNINLNSPDPFKPMVNTLQLDSALEDVKALKNQVDFVVVSAHWGVEYSTKPSKRQVQCAHALAEAGCDVILGQHPHVLQPVERYTAKDGRECIIAYSLGNFISNQERHYTTGQKVSKGDPRDGVLLFLRLVKDSTGTRVEGPAAVPLWTENRNRVIRVWPMESYRQLEPKLVDIRWKRVWKVLGLEQRPMWTPMIPKASSSE